MQLSELEQCRVKQLAQGFNTAAQDTNPGPLSRESEALSLSYSALHAKRIQKQVENNMSSKHISLKTRTVDQLPAMTCMLWITLRVFSGCSIY